MKWKCYLTLLYRERAIHTAMYRLGIKRDNERAGEVRGLKYVAGGKREI